LAIALFLGAAAEARRVETPPPASGSAAAPHDPNYYAYATRYYLQYLSAQGQGAHDAKDPYHFFHYYRYYQERYAAVPASGSLEGQAPAWFATMPFRNARTQAFARFVQPATPSAAPVSPKPPGRGW
jgi:hypothetical protein